MDFKFNQPDSPSSIRRLNEVADLADLFKQMRGDNRNITIEFTQSGVVVKFIGVQPIYARLLTSPHYDDSPHAGSDCCSGSLGGSGTDECCPPGYGWEQVIPDGCGSWDVVAEDVRGDYCNLPLYEINGIQVPMDIDGLPTIVQAWPDGRGKSMLFVAGSAVGGTPLDVTVATCVRIEEV